MGRTGNHNHWLPSMQPNHHRRIGLLLTGMILFGAAEGAPSRELEPDDISDRRGSFTGTPSDHRELTPDDTTGDDPLGTLQPPPGEVEPDRPVGHPLHGWTGFHPGEPSPGVDSPAPSPNRRAPPTIVPRGHRLPGPP